MIRQPNLASNQLPKLLTPAGGMILSVGLSVILWGGLVIGAHIAGAF